MLVFILHRLCCFIGIYRQIGQFSEQVVRSGDVSIADFRVYAKLLNWRSKGDYSDLFDFSKEDVDSMMEPARNFITCVCGLIDLP